MTLVRKAGQVTFKVKGEKGAKLRMRDWKVGLDCLAGDDKEPFYDVVIYKTVRYLCLVSHTATDALNPQVNVASSTKKYWAVATDWEFIASKLALVERIKAEDIDTDGLIAKNVATASEGPRIEMVGSEMKIFGSVAMNIRLGVDDKGMAVLEYYNNDGRKLYNLGPDGITKIPVELESWTTYYFKPLGTDLPTILTARDYKEVRYDSSYIVYQYHSKVIAGVVDDPVNDKLYFKGENTTSKLPSGWYVNAPAQQGDISIHREYPLADESLARIYPQGIHANNEPVYAKKPVCYALLTQYIGGKAKVTQRVYWNGDSSGNPR